MKETNCQLKNGLVFALLTALISGVAIFYSKIAVAKVEPLILTTCRNSIVSLLFLALFLSKIHDKKIATLTKRQLFFLILIGLVGGGLPFFLFFTGLKLTNALTANFIHKTLFIWVSMLATLFLREKLKLTYIIGFILVLAGNILASGLPSSWGKGEFLVFLATLLWAVENVLAKKILNEVQANTVALFRMGIGAVLLFLLTLISGKGRLLLDISPEALPVILIGSIILFGYNFFWYRALRYIPATLATFILTFSVVVGSLLNGYLAGIKLAVIDYYSLLLILLGVGLVLVQSFYSKLVNARFNIHG